MKFQSFVGCASPDFAGAQFVRVRVFVEEQQIPEENEIDEVDAWCTHWVAYHHPSIADAPITTAISDTSDSQSTPLMIPTHAVATLRLFFHSMEPASDITDTTDTTDTTNTTDTTDTTTWMVFRLGRVAVVPSQRGTGLGKKLCLAAEQLLQQQASDPKQLLRLVQANPDYAHVTALPQHRGVRVDLHSQFDKNGFYERLGYRAERCPVSGEYTTFLEEGILHTNMSKVVCGAIVNSDGSHGGTRP